MKHEALEQEQIGLTPEQRLECIRAMMYILDFENSEAYKVLDGDQREQLQVLEEAGMATSDPKIGQHYFEQIKIFFIENLDYKPEMFDDANLVQFKQRFKDKFDEYKERDEIAEKIASDVEHRIQEIIHEKAVLYAQKPRTKEIKEKMQTLTYELRKLQARRDKMVDAVYKTRHKTSVN